MKKLFILLLNLFLISFVSANGLQITSSSVEINKTNNIDIYFNINITNQETFKFYNITSNSIISFDKFDLESGQTKIINAKISSNDNFNGTIKIIGEYYTNLGSSNETEIITIDSSGLDLCNLDLIKGDTIIWKNTLSGDVKLKNLNSGEYFTTINGNSNYTHKFQESIEFDYQVFKTGLPFSDICPLNIRPESGYIHSSEYDAEFDLNLNINYEPTIINTIFLEDSYILNYNSQKEDIFKIINNGNNIAKNIKLSGEWFEFDLNNFDLAIGESKNIGYTIKPIIFQTNKTNKTYNKLIKIEGNFNTLEKSINIFINHQNIEGIYGNSSYDKEQLKNIVNFFCSIYPDDCPKTIVYEDESNRNVTFTVNEETYKENILEEDSFREEMRNILNLQNEELMRLKNKTNSYLNNSNENSNEVKKLSDSTENLLGAIILGGIILLAISIIIAVCVILFNEKAMIKVKKLFHKGELNI